MNLYSQVKSKKRICDMIACFPLWRGAFSCVNFLFIFPASVQWCCYARCIVTWISPPFFLLEKVMFSSEDPDVILVRFWCYSNDSLIRFFSPLFQDQFYSWKTGRFPSWDSDIILERLPGFFQDQYDILFFFRWGWNFSLFWMKPILIRGRQLFDHFYSFFLGEICLQLVFIFFKRPMILFSNMPEAVVYGWVSCLL